MRYVSSPDFQHDSAERIGILLVNSGTPEAPTAPAVRRFLRRFLSDPRVVELPRALWLPLLYGVVLPLRPARVARKYRRIWTEAGSPLREFSQRLRDELTAALARRLLAPLSVELGMLYSPPSVREALARLRASGAQRILVLPLFPQYCGATTGAVYDQVSAELNRWRWLPELRFVAEYHDHPGYIDALRASVVEHWERHGRTPHLLMSFHGIPERNFHRGDPYFCKCQKTARLLADELMLRDSEWSAAFQSRFGVAGWLKPYTREVLEGLPARGVRAVTLVCPGFAADCLETLEEIDIENRAAFMRAGGERFQYVPALNARPVHAQCLTDLIEEHCQGWTHLEHGRLPSAARGASA
ncbi:MAG TPA: ferrochelatase [Steroidobacteraceae bacterium]|nr:ferrochelatase [Steroidobacteraceae bacterium]